MQVNITLTRRVKYATTVKITKKEFVRLTKELDSKDCGVKIAAEKHVNGLVDPRDAWQDDELMDIDEFCEYVPYP